MTNSEIDLLIALIICVSVVFICFAECAHEIDKRFKKLEQESGKKSESSAPK